MAMMLLRMSKDQRIELVRTAAKRLGGKAVLGRRLGYSDGAFIGQMLSGKRAISEKTLMAISGIRELSDLLQSTESAGQPDTPSTPPPAYPITAERPPKHYAAQGHENDTVHIPHYDTGGAMGHGLVLKDQPGVIRGWTVNEEWLAKNARNYTAAKNLVIVTGFGDSMRPIFQPGDPLLVDTGVAAVDFDGIYFFRVGDEGFVKRLQRIPGEGLVAISENKAYRDWTVRPDMDFQVFGRVIKAWCGEDY